jgi:hypothetical protein
MKVPQTDGGRGVVSTRPPDTDRKDLPMRVYSTTRKRFYTRKPAEERFWPKVNKDGPLPSNRPDLGPCWLWTGARNRQGYGSFFLSEGRWVWPHRFAYELTYGPIPEDLVLDHLCRNPSCVRPGHLEAVLFRVNVLRGTSSAAENAYKTACVHGHRLDLFNTYRSPEGHRQCRICRADAETRRQAKRRLVRRDS